MFILQHSKINCVAFIQAVNYSFSLTHSLTAAPTPWGTGARAPTCTNSWARGHREWQKQQTRNWAYSTDHHESAHRND